MAIDTALKRRSIIQLGLPWRDRLPTPDGTFTSADRYMLVGLYAGLVATAPVQLDLVPNLSARFNSGTHDFDLSVYFSGQTSYSIAPALEVGWSFDVNTGILTIDTDAASTFGPYAVTATNGSGNAVGNNFTVKVAVSTVTAYGTIAGLRTDLRI